jgi:LEA14-like dessication related protein
MIKTAWGLLCTVWVLLVCGCSGMQFHYETPTLSLSSFRILPSDAMGPRFEIGLHIINPNRSSMKIYGVVYTVKIAGHRILTGVANDIPTIDGYGEGDVLLNTAADLFSSISLITNLLQERRDSIAYELEAKLDLGRFRPDVHVEKRGTISLSRSGQ